MPSYTDPKEFAIIREMYFDTWQPSDELDTEERAKRNLIKLKNNQDQT